jgi:alpha-L-arabinofuranosidase
VLQVVNASDREVAALIELVGFTPAQPAAQVEELAAPLDAVNTAAEPRRVAPRTFTWRHDAEGGALRRTFPPHSFTVVRW